MRTHAREYSCTCSQRAKRTSHRLALCLLIMCAPLALFALGFITWGFSNLGLVTVQYGMYICVYVYVCVLISVFFKATYHVDRHENMDFRLFKST